MICTLQKYPYSLCILMAIVSVLIFYINNLNSESKEHNKPINYIKIGLMSIFVVGATIFVLKYDNKTMVGGGIKLETSVIPEQIHTGNPSF